MDAMMRPSYFLFLFVFWCFNGTTQASDSLRISISQADSIFITGNYRLLASSMNVNMQEAQIIQARLYPNPVFTADVNMLDPENDRIFHTGATGQKFFQLEQLILLGGKRKAQIDLAKTNATIASLEFNDLARQLKFQLHSSMYALNQQTLLLNKYTGQLALLDTILTAYETQMRMGNIPLKDVVRLRGVYLGLNNDRSELLQYYLEELSKVQAILQTDLVVVPLISDQDLDSVIKLFSLTELQNAALTNRADYLILQENKTAAEQYYRLQKREAIPDMNLFSNYDQRSGAFVNQVNIGFSIPLPVWNRNKGNIRAAGYQIKQAEYSQESMKNEILVSIQNHFILYNHTVTEYQKITRFYNSDFDLILKGMSDNFQKRNVSVLEFVDLFESYNNSLAEIARIKIQLAVSAEQLNLDIGKQTF